MSKCDKCTCDICTVPHIALLPPQGSVVVFGRWPSWTSEDLTSQEYCKETPMVFAFVLQIIRWVRLTKLIF